VVGEQTFVGIPTDVMKDHPLLRRTVDCLHVAIIVLEAVVDSTHMIEYYSETVVVRRAERMGK
jgi:hypothetical protein